MRNKIMNVFLAIGIVAIVIMLLTFDVSYDEIWNNLRRAGWWFIAVVLIWLPIYLLNACSWNVIINNGSKHKAIPFVKVLKYTISGYALNYVTPVGVLGGEPYRIMEIKPYLGTAKATSSVILYAMMHIFSHFIFWAFSIVLYILMYFDRIDMMMGLFLVIVAAFCSLGIYFFMKGYRNGLAMKTLRVFTHVPGLRRKARRFVEEKKDTVKRIDAQIAELHRQNKRTFHLSLFMPLEMGTREGGFALAVGGLSMSGAFGVLAGLLTRIRELIWVAIGIGLIKVGKGKLPVLEEIKADNDS